MLHGIGATLARRLGPGQLRIFPGVSSVALACARLGWPEHETEVVSLVSPPAEAALAAMRPGGRVMLLCRDGATPGQVAGLLAEHGWGDSELTVLERLGGPAERVAGPVRACDLARSAGLAGPATSPAPASPTCASWVSGRGPPTVPAPRDGCLACPTPRSRPTAS